MARHNLLSRHSYAVTHYPPAAVRQGRGVWAGEVGQWLRTRAKELGVAYVPGSGPLRAGPDGPPPVVLPGLPGLPALP